MPACKPDHGRDAQSCLRDRPVRRCRAPPGQSQRARRLAAAGLRGAASFIFSSERGIGMDVQLRATRAVLLDRDDIGATVSGLLRIRSTGGAGTISGDLDVVEQVHAGARRCRRRNPQVASSKSTGKATKWRPSEPPSRGGSTSVPRRLALHVEGLGMTSEWAADLQVDGTVTNPSIKGTATLVDGSYDFAGKRFDLREGRLTFTGAVPVDPVRYSRRRRCQRPQCDYQCDWHQPASDHLHVEYPGHAAGRTARAPALRHVDHQAFRPRRFGWRRLRLCGAEIPGLVRSTRSGARPAFRDCAFCPPIPSPAPRRRLLRARISGGSTSSSSQMGRATVRRASGSRSRWLSLLSTVSTIGRQSVGARISKDY